MGRSSLAARLELHPSKIHKETKVLIQSTTNGRKEKNSDLARDTCETDDVARKGDIKYIYQLVEPLLMHHPWTV